MLKPSTEPVVRNDGPPPAAVPRPWTDRYERQALAGICLLAAVLCLWGLQHSTYHAFYASAVRSMTDSPADFFYGAFDPAGSITLDKLPGFLWPQALSALVFGFHPWALVLPQALEMVGCVLLLHVLVRRWAGVGAGLLAAAFLTLTPVTVGLGRSVTEDAPFVLILLLAAEATWRAAERGRPRTLLLAGTWVGLAFQCKMLEAWAVLPALAATYLVAAPAAARRRIAHVALAGAVTVAVSVSWMLVAALTPAGSRPYLDGTTNDSPFALVVGYNFLTRFHVVGDIAAGTGSIAVSRMARAGHEAGPGMGDSVWKMIAPGLASQTGWLYPLAALGLAGGIVALRRRRPARTDRQLTGLVLWGSWFLTFFAVFSFGSVTGHTYYMGVVAVAVAALAAAGFVQARRSRVLLPAVLAVNVVWCVSLALRYRHFETWAAPCAAALALVAVALAALRRPAALATGLAAVLLIPAVWSASALSLRYNQPGSLGRVGPTSVRGGSPRFTLAPEQRRLLAYLTAHRGGARYLAAVSGWESTAPYVIAADAPLLPMGGYTGQVPFPQPAAFRTLVDTGRLRYVLVPRADLRHGARDDRRPVGTLLRWTAAHCMLVPRSAYDRHDRSKLLYDCGPAHQR
ncbi:glycosyltransferase family 39 protein [Streptomyces sp. CoH27]|uniref:ArnT family glycosyltransferase n=1 Tax=Streptomyces sp. CoH27 TaxID=2875763 RepID=UPI001CD525BA|nr:glycosyltransferase family 39 protein [Streptomyces sp. CoH27]